MAANILIRTPNHLGDCIMAIPMIAETREAYPGARVTLLTPMYLADLFKGNPALDEIIGIPADAVHGLISVKRIVDLLSGHNFDIGYVLPPSFGAAASFKLSGVKERIGYIADGRRLLLSKPLALPTPLNSEHRSQLYFNLLRRGAGVELDYYAPKLFLNDEDIDTAAGILAGYGISEGERYVTLAVQAVAESRRWGAANYLLLAEDLTRVYNAKIVVVGGSDDVTAGDNLVNHLGPETVANLAGKTSLRESAAVISRSACFVGNDSGPAHLAAAVGTPLVVLSGADDPKSTSPVSKRKNVLYADHLDCISCVKNKCPLSGDDFMRCMTEITVSTVGKAVSELLV
jgi:lipopolysaccharide heptosyltransferase II